MWSEPFAHGRSESHRIALAGYGRQIRGLLVALELLLLGLDAGTGGKSEVLEIWRSGGRLGPPQLRFEARLRPEEPTSWCIRLLVALELRWTVWGPGLGAPCSFWRPEAGGSSMGVIRLQQLHAPHVLAQAVGRIYTQQLAHSCCAF